MRILRTNKMILRKQKAYLVLFSLLLIVLGASAQKETLFIYRSGAVIYEKAVTEIDSVIFCKICPTGLNMVNQQDTLSIYKSGKVVFEKAVTEIDSMIYRKTEPSTPLFVTGTLTGTIIEGCSVAEVPVAVNTVAALEMMPGSVVINDACSAKEFLAVSSTDVVSGSCPITITRTYSIKDVCNNSVSIVHVITIRDTTPPIISGMPAGTTIQGCSVAEVPVAVNTVAALEMMPGSIRINDACSAKEFLAVSSTDVVSGSCPITVTRTYSIKDVCNNSVSIVQVITIRDTSPPVVIGMLTGTIIQGCPEASVPVAVTTVDALEKMPGLVTINDACTAKALLTVSSSDVVTGNCPKTVTRTYIVKDECNNSVSLDHIITIEENNSPNNVNQVNIPAGTFTMGSPTNEVNRNPDENQHTVTLSAFKMSQYEITNAQYAAFLNTKRIGSDGRYAAGSYPTQILINSSQGSNDWGLHYTGGKWVPATGYENYPVIYVTWYGAAEFATYEGGRLPTEAEWEYACRAGTVTPFNTGICLSGTEANYDWRYPYLNCINNSSFTGWATRKVDSNPPNAWGLYNMHGNVWEWCSDWGAPYEGTDLTNPSGPLTGTNRLIRGGGNSSVAASCRSGFRNFTYTPEYSSFTIGIRLVFQSP